MSSSTLQLLNHAETVLRNLSIASLYLSGNINFSGVTAGEFRTRSLDNSYVKFMARDNDTDVLTECARLSSLSNPEFSIPRCGTIALMPNTGLFAGNAEIGLPLAAPLVDLISKVYYDAATDELRIYDGAAWHVH